MNSKPCADLTQSSDRSKRVRDPVGYLQNGMLTFSRPSTAQSVRDLVGWLQNYVLISFDRLQGVHHLVR
jgi:hypothetical protein